jgi:hypothetical protein
LRQPENSEVRRLALSCSVHDIITMPFRSDQAPRSRRGDACGDWPQLQCERFSVNPSVRQK